MGIQLCVPFVL